MAIHTVYNRVVELSCAQCQMCGIDVKDSLIPLVELDLRTFPAIRPVE
jgi:hypothetical protein